MRPPCPAAWEGSGERQGAIGSARTPHLPPSMALAFHQADSNVLPPRSAAAPAWVVEGGGEGAMSRRAIARAQHLPSLSRS